MSDKTNTANGNGPEIRTISAHERRAFDRVVFHVDAELALPDGKTVKGEIVNVSLVGLLFVSAETVSERGDAKLSIGDEVKNLNVKIVDESKVGLHLETLPNETDIRDLVLKHASIARLFLPYIYSPYDEDY